MEICINIRIDAACASVMMRHLAPASGTGSWPVPPRETSTDPFFLPLLKPYRQSGKEILVFSTTGVETASSHIWVKPEQLRPRRLHGAGLSLLPSLYPLPASILAAKSFLYHHLIPLFHRYFHSLLLISQITLRTSPFALSI